MILHRMACSSALMLVGPGSVSRTICNKSARLRLLCSAARAPLSRVSPTGGSMARVRIVTGVVILLFGLAASSAAQGTGDIVGRVADASGGVLPGVSVTATSLATNISRTTVTSETGDYTFTLLPIGVFEVKTELTGFKTQTARVTLGTGDRARVDVRLELGTGHARSPLWSPDGRRIVFGSTRE